MFLIATLVLLVMLILTIMLFNQIKTGTPLGFFTNNLYQSYLKNSKSMGKSYYVVFYVAYSLFGLFALLGDAWLSFLIAAAYMFVNYKFFEYMRADHGEHHATS